MLMQVSFKPTSVIPLEVNLVIMDYYCAFHSVILTHEREIQI